jgi:hypothetical protein
LIHGSLEAFGVECALDRRDGDGKYIFGRIRYWVKGEPLGDIDVVVLIGIVADRLRDSLQYRGKRDAFFVHGLPAQATADEMWRRTFGDERSHGISFRETQANREKFLICPNGCESFDGVFAILLEEGAGERLVWSGMNNVGTAREARLPADSFERGAREFVAWFDSLH